MARVATLGMLLAVTGCAADRSAHAAVFLSTVEAVAEEFAAERERARDVCRVLHGLAQAKGADEAEQVMVACLGIEAAFDVLAEAEQMARDAVSDYEDGMIPLQRMEARVRAFRVQIGKVAAAINRLKALRK